MSNGSQNHTFVWHDLMSTDRDASEPFHTALFGWELEVVQPMDYHMLRADGAGFAGVNAWDRPGIPSHWIGYIQVASVDETNAKAKELGGQVLDGPHDIPTVGRIAVLADPQGGAFCIIEKANADVSMNEDVPMDAEGKVLWNELMTTDVDGAVAFYSGLFGWGSQVGDVGAGPYTMATIGETPVAGIFKKPDEVPAVAWGAYFRVADIDASLKKAGELGGQVIMPVMEVPTVGKFAWITDPAGAATAIMQPPADS